MAAKRKRASATARRGVAAAAAPVWQPLWREVANSPAVETPDEGHEPDPSRGAGFLARLGVVGYAHLEPVLLAALALEAPVLLVGAHGTAKSLLVERIAAALGLGFRHYNASLLNYDDLVGIPLPSDDGLSLRFIGTPGAIWGAGFVFFDEISRCRPDLQNKLFPIVHERRVAGVALPDLRFRWAAMNPPAAADAAPGADVYLGSEALDPALADRFPFVIRVPGWKELVGRDRVRLLGADTGAPGEGSALAALVAGCRARLAEAAHARSDAVTDYVIGLVDRLAHGGAEQSPRRARMLAESVTAVHAARCQLFGDDADLEESADLALVNGLPQTASPEPPSAAAVRAAHRAAWEIASRPRGDALRMVLSEPDPVRRVPLGAKLALAEGDLARIVTQALAEEPCDARRVGIATALFLAFCESHSLTPAAWEALSRLARRVLEPHERDEAVAPGRDLETWREISAFLAKDRAGQLERSFLHAGFPDLWRGTGWRPALERFRADLALFGVAR